MADWSPTEIKAGQSESLVLGFPPDELEIDEERSVGQNGQVLKRVPGYKVEPVGQNDQSCKIVLSSPAKEDLGLMIRRKDAAQLEAERADKNS